ncbi:MAG: hypothetical protein M5T61_00925 [Acidimicrobiia bacterium]|nr:hypothetical protein [Acidimicrobiia bacterium]
MRKIAYGLVSLLLAMSAACGGGGGSGGDGSLVALANTIQRHTSASYIPLTSWSGSLEDSDVVGVGTIVDVRAGMTFVQGKYDDGTDILDPRMLLVIEPTRLVEGAELLGASGQILVQQNRSSAVPLDDVARTIDGAQDQIAFFLREMIVPIEMGDAIRDEFAGRASDDPVFTPVYASALLGVQGTTAFPLLTGEELVLTDDARQVLGSLGVEIDGFAVVKLGTPPALAGSTPDKPPVPPDDGSALAPAE